MKKHITFTLALGAGLLFGTGCQSNKETLLMGDFFTGNLVSYQGGKMDVIASGFRGADAGRCPETGWCAQVAAH